MRLLFIVLLGLSLLSCQRKRPEETAESAPSIPTIDRAQWITKVVSTLRRGDGVKSQQELNEWLQLSDEEVVDKLLSGPQFGNMALDFQLYFLGFKSSGSWFETASDPASPFFNNLYDHAVAIDGARALARNEDPLSMLRADVPIPQKPMPPVLDFQNRDAGLEQLKILSYDESKSVRLKKIKEIRDNLPAFATLLASEKPSLEAVCQALSKIETGFESFLLPFEQLAEDPFFLGSYFQLRSICGTLDLKTDMSRVAELGKIIVKGYPVILSSVEALLDYHPTSIGSIQNKSPAAPRQGESPELIKSNRYADTWRWFWATMQNSSTNYNRKRAAYVLKRFLCDDLTPVNIVNSGSHAADNKHASDASCQSCHYKLDPMAGYFRYIGGGGSEMSRQTTEITFSDGARKPLEEYIQTWRSADDSARPWNVGYVRSLTDPTHNEYSPNTADPSIDDLMQFLRTSKDVRQCYVRRLYEYVVSEKQALDPGYLAEVTDTYMEKAKAEPAQAFKDVIKTYVASNSYKHASPKLDECYDYRKAAEGAAVDGESRPPCRIAFILERNCTSCHNKANPSGRLDLTTWSAVDGGAQNFGHLQADGQQVATKATLKSVLDRLGEVNAERRMPLNQFMSDQDRSALYLWVSEKLAQ